MESVKIAHGLFSWQDGRPALEACLRSTVPHVDHVIIADGLIEGVPDLGLPRHSDLAWLAEPSEWLPPSIPTSCGDAKGVYPWGTLSGACNWILGKARSLGCEWLLYVDADQELHNGDRLHAWLDTWKGDTFSITRQEPGRRMFVPWQCIRVESFTRYISGCSILEHTNGEIVTLVPPNSEPAPQVTQGPWISHHPERRPPWRRAQRLGQFETILEPPPAATALHLPASVLESPR